MKKDAGRNSNLLASRLAEYLWRQRFSANGNIAFQNIIAHIHKKYKFKE
jgi:hypothetical protein